MDTDRKCKTNMILNEKIYSETQEHSLKTTSFRFEVKLITQSKQRLRTASANSNFSSYSSFSNKSKIDSNNLKIYNPSTLSNNLLKSSSKVPVILPIQSSEKSKTFNLTDHLKSNIQFDVTLKPSFCIRNNRLDASLSISESVCFFLNASRITFCLKKFKFKVFKWFILRNYMIMITKLLKKKLTISKIELILFKYRKILTREI